MEVTLNAVKRETRGKNEARRLRASGRIPAVLYGGTKGEGPVALAVEPKALSRILHSESGVNSLIDLSIEGEGTTKVLVKEFLVDPIKHHLMHADFYRVALDRPITVRVQVQVTGEARGVKQQGGILDFVTREIEIDVLPTRIPESIVVDVSELLIGQSIRMRDLSKDAAWTAVTEPDVMIVHVVAHRGPIEEAAPAATEAPAAAAEPEVIKKGKAEKAEG
jgi:large subunit ribosomal protein L25